MKNLFNIIIDKLPSEYQGVKIRTDFKQGLKFFRILDSAELDNKEKASLIMLCLFEEAPPNDPNLWDYIKSYIAGGTVGVSGAGEKTFCFNQDSGKIYSAFRQVYGIDLREESMHWFTFLEMFKCLPEGTHLASVIEIRTKEIPRKCDPKTKNKIIKAKALYGLKTNKTLDISGFFK